MGDHWPTARLPPECILYTILEPILKSHCTKFGKTSALVLNQCFCDVRKLYHPQVSDGNNHKNDYRGDVGKKIRVQMGPETDEFCSLDEIVAQLHNYINFVFSPAGVVILLLWLNE